MDPVFHHVLWDVAQIQLVLGLRRLEAQLWQKKQELKLLSRLLGAKLLTLCCEEQAGLHSHCDWLVPTFMFENAGISV